MKNFIESYSKIIESMKSSNTEKILEDKDERIKRREERRRERAEGKFKGEEGKEDGKFNLKAFKKAIESIKEQSYAKENECEKSIKLKDESYKSSEKHAPEFRDISRRCAKLLGNLDFRIEKEGRNLESDDPNDVKLMGIYRKVYNTLLKDLNNTIQSYIQNRLDNAESYYDDDKYQDIAGKILDAIEKFSKGEKELGEQTSNIQSEISKILLNVVDKKEDKPSSDVAEIKVTNPIKKGTGSKANPDETVKKVQELINKKFKENKDVTKTAQWKEFSKYGADGAFGKATGNMIILLKKRFSLPAKYSHITQEFINKLTEIKESKFSGGLLSFENFLANRR